MYDRYKGKSNTPKKILIAMPSAMLNAIDEAAASECRTRSDYVREALRTQLRISQNRAAIKRPLNPQVGVV